jgi:hypothetical protein
MGGGAMGRGRKVTIGVGLWALVAGIAATTAHAYPAHRRLFRATYDKAVGCQLCHGHGGGTERNAYGAAWQKLGESMQGFRTLEGQDADGDGISNLDEIKAGSNPGEKTSTPSAPGEGLTSKAHMLLPMDQLPMVFADIDSFEAQEPDLTPAQIKTIETAAGRPLEAEERYPTLYFAIKDGKRVGVASFGYARMGSKRTSVLVGMTGDGKVKKALVFRGDAEALASYRAHLDKIVGKSRGEVLKTLEAGPAASADAGKSRKALGQSVEVVLATVVALFSKG